MSKVSVIIPVYNIEQYVGDAIRSIMSQTHRDLDIIVVDDGSTDGSGLLCDALAQKDRRIRVIHKENGGLSDARNAGLDIAEGEYIYFLDGDDTADEKLIETALSYMTDDVDLVRFQYTKSYESGGTEDVKRRSGDFRIPTPEKKYKFLYQIFLRAHVGWEAWGGLYKRSLIEEYGLRFADNSRIFAEDLYFNTCYIFHARRIIAIESCLYHYRIRQESIMRVQSKRLNVGRMNELAKEVLRFAERFEDCRLFVERFQTLFYFIMVMPVRNAQKILNGYMTAQIRERVLDDIQDLGFFYQQLGDPRTLESDFLEIFSDFDTTARIAYLRYYIHGSRMRLLIENIRDLAYFKFHDPEDIRGTGSRNLLERLKNRKERVILYLGSDEYGNVGDHAINEYTNLFLKPVFEKEKILEVTGTEYRRDAGILHHYVSQEDVLILPGGGNFGNRYNAEKIREDIMETWPSNRKVMFPQSACFTDDSEGDKALAQASERYRDEANITLFARDPYTFDLMRKNFDCPVYLCPDIVLVGQATPAQKRDRSVLICLRSDKEGRFSEADIRQLERRLTARGSRHRRIDLQKDYMIFKEDRRRAVAEHMSAFAGAGLVITDRLHGVIFSAITGTPCIAVDNYNGKVRRGCEWLSDLPYIHFCDDDRISDELIRELMYRGQGIYNPGRFDEYYMQLRNCLTGV